MKTIVDFFGRYLMLLKTMQVMDMVDILLVTLLVYEAFQLVRRSHSGRIFRAVAIILALAWITDAADLHIMNFLVTKVLELGLLALVVLFQPELRRAVERVGSTQFRSLLSPKERNKEVGDVISETVRACEAMSREKVGALMVFERTSRLDEFFKTGTVIDGKASEQLIRNIFFPKAALHDGAMILRNGRVTAAGCVLPLSDNQQLSSDLGTRHRAGVGISEVTDAVVVIVSEETGTISVAVGGMLKRHLAPQMLERLLTNELTPEEKPVKQKKLFSGKDGQERGGKHEK